MYCFYNNIIYLLFFDFCVWRHFKKEKNDFINFGTGFLWRIGSILCLTREHTNYNHIHVTHCHWHQFLTSKIAVLNEDVQKPVFVCTVHDVCPNGRIENRYYLLVTNFGRKNFVFFFTKIHENKKHRCYFFFFRKMQ